MSITKWYEIFCDYCSNAQHFQGSIKSVEEQFKDYGGIVAKKKYYCSKDCQIKNENSNSQHT